MSLCSSAWRITALAAIFVLMPSARTEAQTAKLIGHWPLAEDTRDHGPNALPTKGVNVSFSAAMPGAAKAGLFNGRDSLMTVTLPANLAPGTDDFTIALWAHTQETLTDDLGDLVSWFDPVKRTGFELSLRTNTGVTTSQSNTRQLQFGIDAGTEPVWSDVGRPGNAVLAFSLAVHDGQLYAGTCGNGAEDVGRVFRFEASNRWIDCGAPDVANAISAMASFQGKLYVASSKYRFAGSALVESPNLNRGGRVFRYEGDSRWTNVGELPETEAIGGLVVYNGALYASSLYKPAGFFRFEKDGKWTSLPVPDEKRVESLGVFNGYLWATSYDGGRVYRFDGTSWKDFGQLGDNTQTYSFAIHEGQLHVGTWRSGKVFRLNDREGWDDVGQLGEEWEVMGMLVHNGKLYAGTLPLAEVYRYDGGTAWTKTARLDLTPDQKYRRAWTMAQFDGRLFCSTLPSGKVFAMNTGVMVTHDRELPAGWRHVVATKSGKQLLLYVDGRRVAQSAEFDPGRFALTGERPLRIGAGAGDRWNGSLRDVRLYRGSLTEEEIARLAKP